MLTLHLADREGLRWAQQQVMQQHYLHAPVDPRCSPVAYLIHLFQEPVGCLIFGRPEATRVMGWYGSVEDVTAGRCPFTRWQIINLARVWLHPDLQRGGRWYHPPGQPGPSVLPGFSDRTGIWHSCAASLAIEQALARIAFDYLLVRPPVWLEEPYELAQCISYCNMQIHKGTLYHAAGFQQVRKNARGIATYVRSLRHLTEAEHQAIAQRSRAAPRCQRLRAAREGRGLCALSYP